MVGTVKSSVHREEQCLPPRRDELEPTQRIGPLATRRRHRGRALARDPSRTREGQSFWARSEAQESS